MGSLQKCHVLQLHHFLNQLTRHFLSVAIQYARVVEIEQCVLDAGETGAAAATFLILQELYKFIDIISRNLYIPGMKPIEFVGSSQDDIRNFPAEARRAAGFELNFVQMGLTPSDWKPMKTIGPGVMEIRIHKEGEWRVIYVAKFEKAIYVLHAFEKKTQKTRRADIELAQQRYKEIGSQP